MGKARKSRGFKTSENVKEVHECEDQQKVMQEIGLCITDLPKSIAIGILSSLPLNCVLICRCVCKTWRNLIKDSEFVKLNFSQAEAYPLIRKVGPTDISRILYFVDQPPKYKPCYDSRCNQYHNFCHYNCENHVNMKLATKLKIPLHNAELAMNGEGEANHSKRKRATKLRSKDHKLNLVNSCNGFLCLSEPLHNDPVMVCNPITGEFIKLPVPTKRDERSQELSYSGLGFCPKTNQYKVVRIFSQEGRSRMFCRVVEIHTLGTNTWKMIRCAPYLHEYGKATYLNGTLNWLHLCLHKSSVPYKIASFDIGKEKFQSIPIPPKTYGQLSSHDKDRIWIGELRGCLCVSDASDVGREKIELWVMGTYGVESSWKVEIKIDISTLERRLPIGSYQPMSYFKDGTLLFFHPLSGSMFCYEPDDRRLKILNVSGRQSSYEAISYIPSFSSLKDAMAGDDVEVYNVKSRCGGLKLPGESIAVSLVEKK